MSVALLLALAWGAFAFGAVYPWAYVPLAAACALIAIAGFLPRRDVQLAPMNRALAIGLALVAAAIVVQLIPLPHDTLLRLNPGTDAFLQRYDVQYAAMVRAEEIRSGETVTGLKPGDPAQMKMKPAGPAGAHALSIDPAKTMLGLSLFVVFGFFLLGLTRGLTSRQVRRFAPWLVGIGVVLALVGIVQQAGFNGKIYGFWVPEAGIRPSTPGGGIYGPFVNRNHFAGWMLMALPVGLGYFCGLVARSMRGVKPGFHDRFLWFASSEASRLILVAAGLVVMAIALVLSLSRSGITCFAVALALCGLVVARRQTTAPRRVVLTAYVLFVGVLAVGWAGFDLVAGRFADANRDLALREAVWWDALHIHHDFPVFGSGANTFGIAMLVYQTADPTVHFAEAHNDYVQLLAEGGLLVSVPALVLLVLFVREVRRRFRDEAGDGLTYWIRVGAVTGLVAIGLQEVVEFSLQMPGNTALFCALIAIAAGKLPHRKRRMANDSIGSGLTAQGSWHRRAEDREPAP
jgi:O-antigen ligase